MKTIHLIHQLKWEEMSGTTLKQLIYESDHCKSLLLLMEESNIQNKDSISRILKDNLNNESLADIEKFHNRFVTQDNDIDHLRNDFIALDKMLAHEVSGNGQISDIIRRIKKLRIKIANEEEEFCKLKLEFNRFLVENIFYS